MSAETIERIIDSEWQMFGRVVNEGGRADCQDDRETFRLMRRSQLDAWEEDTLESYLTDLYTAEQQQRNLITEKYARMMASTDPDAYAALASYLPPVAGQKQRLIEAIVSRQVACLARFAARYPHVAARMRPLHTSMDTREQTSFETYLRGELSTYSMDTLLYLDAQLERQGDSYGERIMAETAAGYGYASVCELERRLSE